MTKREARKVALRLGAQLLRAAGNDVDAMPELSTDDVKRVKSALTHIADHLEWEAHGRPERS